MYKYIYCDKSGGAQQPWRQTQIPSFDCIISPPTGDDHISLDKIWQIRCFITQVAVKLNVSHSRDYEEILFSEDGLITEQELYQFYKDMVQLEAEEARENSRIAFSQMTDVSLSSLLNLILIVFTATTTISLFL